MKKILLSLIIIILLIVIFILYFRVKIIRFYRDTCPYCVSSKPEWDKFKNSQFSNLLISTYEIDTDTDEGKELMQQYGLKSVPNIILIDGIKLKTYEGDRSCDDLKKFIK